jgi:dUTP pyrophosphatase
LFEVKDIFYILNYSKNNYFGGKMKFTKVRTVNCISRATAGDAGIDFYVPEFNDEFMNDLISKNAANDISYNDHAKEIVIAAHSQALIPSGVKVVVPEGHALVAFNKSGVASKTGLTAGACVIDEQYRGECHINVLNTSSKPVIVKEGMKLMQYVLLKVNQESPEEISNLEYSEYENTERGAGGFGHTDNK